MVIHAKPRVEDSKKAARQRLRQITPEVQKELKGGLKHSPIYGRRGPILRSSSAYTRNRENVARVKQGFGKGRYLRDDWLSRPRNFKIYPATLKKSSSPTLARPCVLGADDLHVKINGETGWECPKFPKGISVKENEQPSESECMKYQLCI